LAQLTEIGNDLEIISLPLSKREDPMYQECVFPLSFYNTLYMHNVIMQRIPF